MKQGDYFKGILDGYLITGRITLNTDSDEDYSNYVCAFDNSSASEDFGYEECEEDYGFSDLVDADEVEDIKIITGAEHLKLLQNPLYGEMFGYSVKLHKGSTSDRDTFTFGCGAVEVTRAEAKTILKLFKTFPEINDILEILANIRSNYTLDDGDISEIEKLLKA